MFVGCFCARSPVVRWEGGEEWVYGHGLWSEGSRGCQNGEKGGKSQSYPKEDELSAILICLLQFCYFKTFLEACQILPCHLLHFSHDQNKQKKLFFFFFCFFCFHFPPLWFVAVSAVPGHLWEKQNQPAPCLMVKSSNRKRAPKAWLCVGPAEREPVFMFWEGPFLGPSPLLQHRLTQWFLLWSMTSWFNLFYFPRNPPRPAILIRADPSPWDKSCPAFPICMNWVWGWTVSLPLLYVKLSINVPELQGKRSQDNEH